MDIVTILNYIIVFFSLFSVCIFLLLFFVHRNDYDKKLPKPKSIPKVSIVIPAYNEEKHIVECLNCVMAIDYPKDKVEIIFVDDGSTDHTYKIAKTFENSRLKIFTKKNSGKGATLNFGISKAKGEVIATMDADSFPTKNVLWELIPYFNDPEVMAVTPAVRIRESKSWLKELQRIEYLFILFSRKLLSFIDSVPVTPGPFSIFRASIFEKIGGFDEKNLVEDHEIALRIQSHNYKIRSSLTADVYTEPPDTITELLNQRVRWQRGGIHNYWHYKFMIKPEYGDFGLYVVPLSILSLFAFFLLLGLMVYSIINTPYYTQYIWVEALGLSLNVLSLIGIFVIVVFTLFLYIAVSSFKDEKVKWHYLLLFVFFFWYLMLGYNLLFLFKELKRERYRW